MSIIAFTGVTRSYGASEALRGVDLVIDRPQVVGLLGRNGAGKSTLLRMIPPLIHATRGSVRVFDNDPWKYQETNKLRLGYLSDSDVHPLGLRIEDLFQLCSEVYPTWDQALVDRFAGRFGLTKQRVLALLSKGQQRQVGLLCAVGHRPELLVLDEPAGGLDPVARRDFLSVVIEVLADSGGTVLFASHLFGDVERLADRIVILHQGRVLVDEPSERLQADACRIEMPWSETTSERLSAWKACARVERTGERLVGTLRVAPADASAGVAAEIGSAPTEVQAIGLEDLFIALTGAP
ncbi:MAG: ABC transporter ATP-binding protein [Planctomycetes bacterium]|nr:ABC transporter ATP-binding protein [Planctomycetota bacterium]